MMMATATGSARACTLGQLLGPAAGSLPELELTGVKLDSRAVKPGDLFLALPGAVHDGRQFIEQAIASGAAAIVAEPPVAGFVDAVAVPLIEMPDLLHEAGLIAARFYDFPSRDLHMVGVTGTNGKTTTSRLVAQLLRQLGHRCGVIGTLGSSLADDITEAANTTPDPVALQQQLARWRDDSVGRVSMEVSSHALTQGRVNGVVFETAVFTNLSRDHLDYHGSMEAYARAKFSLFLSEGLRYALVNLDDPYAAQLLARVPSRVTAITYSQSGRAEADVRISDARFHAAGVHATIQTPWGSGSFDSPLPGDFNQANLAAAISAAVLAGESLAAVLAAVPGLHSVPGRMQTISNDLGLQLIVDYAHTPDALEQALKALQPHVQGRLVTVFGCGGDRDPGKRPVMGQLACQYSDAVIVTSDNPRSENPLLIIADIEAGCSGDYRLLPDRAEAIAVAVQQANKGDCVLVAGKGHENYQLIDGEKLHFDDAEQIRRALAERASV